MSSDQTPGTGLVLQAVSVDYGPLRAVDGVDLAVPAGEILGLLGPSGCGKSTLLRAVAGLEPLTGGTITWQGNDLAAVPVHRRGIGFMFQEHALFPHRNVADNVAFGLRMARTKPAIATERVRDMLELVGLAGFGDRTIGTLSGGQAQRVALARALAPEPQLLLLDEPLASLDRALRDRLVDEIRGIVNQLGLTAIHVTHDHDEAISIADRLALMADAGIIRTGPVASLLTTPGDVATATALGLNTVLAGVVSTEGTLATPFGSLPSQEPPGAETQVLVPPSAVALESGGVTAVVSGSRYHGDAWLLTCMCEDGTVIVAEHSVRLPDGAVVDVTVDLTSAIPLTR